MYVACVNTTVSRHHSSVINYMKKYLPLLIVLQSCIGWGDMFAKRENIISNYYLVESDNGTYDISYKIDGSYVGRNPPNSKVIAYAVKDTILAMKVQPYSGDTFFYAINMKKDYEVAKTEEYELGSIATKDYQSSWLGKMDLHFKDIK